MPLGFGDYSVHISCEDQEISQFDEKKEDETTISCYIPSEAGKHFTIHYNNTSANQDVIMQTYVDGRCMDRNVLVHCGGIKCCLRGVYTSPSVYRPFQFSILKTTDDDTLASLTADQDVGIIEVRMRRVATSDGKELASIFQPLSDVGVVHERSKKAGVHCISLGAEVEEGPMLKTISGKVLDTNPYAIFRFRYRPRDLLQAQGIIPVAVNHSSSAEASNKRASGSNADEYRESNTSVGTKRARKMSSPDDEDLKPDIDSDDDDIDTLEEEIKRMQQRLQEKKAKKSRVKKEPSPIKNERT